MDFDCDKYLEILIKHTKKDEKVKKMNEYDNKCTNCLGYLLLNKWEDMRVCANCGRMSKANLEYHSYNSQFNSNPFIPGRIKHRHKRLRKNLRKMGIDDEDLIKKIFRFFKSVEDYYDLVIYDRKENMIRYAYIISRILQVIGRKDLFNAKYLPKKQTLTRYDALWTKISMFAGWSF